MRRGIGVLLWRWRFGKQSGEWQVAEEARVDTPPQTASAMTAARSVAANRSADASDPVW